MWFDIAVEYWNALINRILHQFPFKLLSAFAVPLCQEKLVLSNFLYQKLYDLK